jgi:hypothetical protein
MFGFVLGLGGIGFDAWRWISMQALKLSLQLGYQGMCFGQFLS